MKNMSGVTVALIACLAMLSITNAAKELYPSSTSYVVELSKANFDKIVTKNRDVGVSIIHYYKNDDDGAQLLAKDINKQATELTGIFKFGAVNCNENSDICAKERVKKTPTVRIYPPNPMPAFDHEGDLSGKSIVNAARNFVSKDKVKEINATTHSRFVDENPSVPKVFLFTEKQGVPLIYRALSHSFDKKIFLAIVKSSEADLVKRYKVKTFPTILVVKTGEPKPIVYSGEFKFQPIFDFLNVYSETFVPGGDQLNVNKPWLSDPVPELTQKSASDIVLKSDGKLNVVYLGKQAPEDTVKSQLEKLSTNSKYENFKFSWLNVDAEPGWTKLFNKADSYPKVIVTSLGGKRKKYLVHEGELTSASIEKTLEKITNGDAHFVTIRGDLPSFVH